MGSDTLYLRLPRQFVAISIHAPRMGSDRLTGLNGRQTRRYFNPRSPDGERLCR